MMTERLYYADSYRRRFTARVLGRQEMNGRPAVALDRTVFYPTGGGQPHDTGTLDGVPVVDVAADGDLVWHVLERELHAAAVAGEVEVAGELDWARRLDHMQQHTGQHVLSEAFIKVLDAHTVSFHMSSANCTIDLDRTGLSDEVLAAVETAANQVVDHTLPVMAEFVDNDDLAHIPLRKMPAVNGPVRIVEVAGYDWSACGGTHVANTAQIGLIKIVGSERRGAETRITFLCGGRARADYARLQRLVEALAARFTTGQDELPAAVDRLAEEARSVRKDLSTLEGEWAEAAADALWKAGCSQGPWCVVATTVDYPAERARRVAQALRAHAGTMVLLGVRGERPQLLFARADDVPVNAGDLLKRAAAAAGGRGGGRPEWAQGGTPDNQGLEVALSAALSTLDSLPKGA